MPTSPPETCHASGCECSRCAEGLPPASELVGRLRAWAIFVLVLGWIGGLILWIVGIVAAIDPHAQSPFGLVMLGVFGLYGVIPVLGGYLLNAALLGLAKSVSFQRRLLMASRSAPEPPAE